MSFLSSASLIRRHALRARPEVGLMRTSVRSDICDVQQNSLPRVQFVISRHVVKRLIAILVVLLPLLLRRSQNCSRVEMILYSSLTGRNTGLSVL